MDETMIPPPGAEGAGTVDDPWFPDVEVTLTGQDGNAFAIIGAVGSALGRAGHRQAARDFPNEAITSDSYDALLATVCRWVVVS